MNTRNVRALGAASILLLVVLFWSGLPFKAFDAFKAMSGIGSAGPSDENIANALLQIDVIGNNISQISVTTTDCVEQEKIKQPGFRGNFWACNFFVNGVTFSTPAPTGWAEWSMNTSNAKTRFVQGVRTGVLQWTQRFVKRTDGTWAAQIVWR